MYFISHMAQGDVKFNLDLAPFIFELLCVFDELFFELSFLLKSKKVQSLFEFFHTFIKFS